MAREHDLPDGLQTLLTVIVGMPWPEGSSGELRQLNYAWRDFHKSISTMPDRLRLVARELDANTDGTATDRVVASLENALPGYMKDLADAAAEFAGLALDTAANIDEAKAMIRIQLVILAGAIVHLATTIFGSLAIPAVVAASRIVISLLRMLLIELIEEVGLGAAIPAIIEAIQVEAGLRTHIDATRWSRTY